MLNTKKEENNVTVINEKQSFARVYASSTPGSGSNSSCMFFGVCTGTGGGK